MFEKRRTIERSVSDPEISKSSKLKMASRAVITVENKSGFNVRVARTGSIPKFSPAQWNKELLCRKYARRESTIKFDGLWEKFKKNCW